MVSGILLETLMMIGYGVCSIIWLVSAIRKVIVNDIIRITSHGTSNNFNFSVTNSFVRRYMMSSVVYIQSVLVHSADLPSTFQSFAYTEHKNNEW